MSHGQNNKFTLVTKCKPCKGRGMVPVKTKTTWKWLLIWSRPSPLDDDTEEVCKSCGGVGRLFH